MHGYLLTCVDCILLWAIAVRNLPYQTKVLMIPTNPASLVNKIAPFSGLGLSQREMSSAADQAHGRSVFVHMAQRRLM